MHGHRNRGVGMPIPPAVKLVFTTAAPPPDVLAAYSSCPVHISSFTSRIKLTIQRTSMRALFVLILFITLGETHPSEMTRNPEANRKPVLSPLPRQFRVPHRSRTP